MLWEILKASKGILVADFYADLWANIAGGGTPVDVFVEMIGTLPLYYNGKGIDLADYLISGNAVQDGTPSLDAPVDATGCGVRTGNLFDATTLENGIYLSASGKKYGDATNGVRSGTKIKALPNTTYTLSAQSSANVSLRIFEWASGTFTKQTPKYNISGSVSLTVTTTAETTEIAFNIEGENGQYATNIMLNLGSTALPYKPYGYKLPLTVNGVEYPIYLGQVETTRRIKKVVFNGTEPWVLSGTIAYIDNTDTKKLSPLICTHFPNVTNTGMWTGNNWVFQVNISGLGMSGIEAWITWLAAQYAAGHPVTVWYVLAEPETAIVNEPLMKIGDYADTISFAQSQVAIPTASGANVLDMTSPVKPSEVYVKGKGIKPTGYGQLTDINGVNILDKDGRPIYVHGQ